jgi:hypothetical protein
MKTRHPQEMPGGYAASPAIGPLPAIVVSRPASRGGPPGPGASISAAPWPGRFASPWLGRYPRRRDYASLADFANPDGNTWILQEVGYQKG